MLTVISSTTRDRLKLRFWCLCENVWSWVYKYQRRTSKLRFSIAVSFWF